MSASSSGQKKGFASLARDVDAAIAVLNGAQARPVELAQHVEHMQNVAKVLRAIEPFEETLRTMSRTLEARK